MKQVHREEIQDFVTYEEKRVEVRESTMKIKEVRRIDVGEKDIQYEIKTYNEILGKPGELGCTLLIQIDDPAVRDDNLSKWLDLPSHLYLKLEDDSLIRATFDERQIGDDRLSSVQYIKFNTKGIVPKAIGSDHPLFKEETSLTAEQKKALSDDL
jgi:hypothetical protein